MTFDPVRKRKLWLDFGLKYETEFMPDQIPPQGPRPLSGRLLGNHLVKMAVRTEGTNRWVLRRGATLDQWAPVNTGQGSVELLLPMEAEQEFYRIDPLP